MKITEKFSEIFAVLSTENKDLQGKRQKDHNIIYSLNDTHFLKKNTC